MKMNARNAALPSWLLLITAFILLLLCSISVPVTYALYFLDSEISGYTRYGIWGWCDYDAGYCWGNYLYWGFDPFFLVSLTRGLVLFPISTIITFLTILALIPASFRSEDYEPVPLAVYPILAVLASLTSLIAFVISMPLFAIARNRLRADGISANFGPCMWMSLVAMILLFVVAVLSIMGRYSRRRTY